MFRVFRLLWQQLKRHQDNVAINDRTANSRQECAHQNDMYSRNKETKNERERKATAEH